MADQVPVCDVLCEAMEYLVKLGSNLRLRSETLKQKRISKEKLRNAHAVKKAAKKVLMICELSRKSLENVESGVNRVLSIVNSSQVSKVGGKTNNIFESPEKPVYKYFEYNNRKLKIAKNISIKHYTSVNVSAKRMSKLMLDKYPIYHDCELYRLRTNSSKIEERANRNPIISCNLSGTSDTEDRNVNKSPILCILKPSENETVKDKNCSPNLDSTSINLGKAVPDSCNKMQENNSVDKSIEILDSDISDEDAKNKSSERQSPDKLKSKKKEKLKANNEHRNGEYRDKKVGGKTATKEERTHKRRRIIYQSDSDSSSGLVRPEDISEDLKENNSKDNDKSKPVECSIDLNNQNEAGNEKNKSGSIDNSMIDGSIDLDDHQANQSDPDNNKDKSGPVECNADLNNQKANQDGNDRSEMGSQKENPVECSIDLDEQTETQNETEKEETDSHKPILKLVNIKSLLKPNLIKEDEPIKETLNSKVDSGESSKNITMKSAMKGIKSAPKRVRYEDDELFWAPKRKEVAAFKPKGCSVDISRMPKITVSFLQEQNISKVTQSGSIICEVVKDVSLGSCNKTEEPRNKEKNTSVDTDDLNLVKKALLIDSDSELSEDEASNKNTDTTKRALLVDSGSESLNSDDADNVENADIATKDNHVDKAIDSSDKPMSKDTTNSLGRQQNDEFKETAKQDDGTTTRVETRKSNHNKDLNDTPNEVVKGTSDSTVQSDILKSSLLNDSSSDSSKGTKNDKESTSSELNDSSNSNTKTSNINQNVANTNVTQGDAKTPSLNPDDIKSSLLNDSSSDNGKSSNNIVNVKSAHGSKEDVTQGDDKTPSLNPDDIKSSLLNDSSSDTGKSSKNIVNAKSAHRSKEDVAQSDDKTSSLNPDDIKSSLLNDSSSDTGKSSKNIVNAKSAHRSKEDVAQSDDKTSSLNPDDIKSSLLNDSSSDSSSDNGKSSKNIVNAKSAHGSKEDVAQGDDKTPSLNPDDIKSSLLNDSSSDNGNSSKNIVNAKSAHGSKEDVTQGDDKTPSLNPEEIKSSLLNDSSSDNGKSSNNIVNAKSANGSKDNLESIHAKKMLLTHSSSSESGDEKINDIFKVIKESLLTKRPDEKPGRKVYTSTESEDDASNKIKKKRKKKCRKSQRDTSDEEGHTKKNSTSIDQVDGTMDEQSNSSNSSKMGRSSEQPGGSTSHNSDSKDDKDIEGLTNLKSLSKTRRRRDSSDSSVTRNSTKKKVAKIPLITGEGLLEMPSNSEDTVGDDSEPNDDVIEDLPEVSGINGSDIAHLAKDDLLEESDSSKTSEDKKDESESEESNVKSRRRKANAISSESEAGSSRPRANNDEKDSDFDDSEEESTRKKKKSKRKKLESDSDASGTSNEDSKKKRRRIKSLNDSDASGSDTENEGKNKHGRKNIRKVMGKNQLEEATKKAARQEKERLARIAERQKKYNDLLFDESGKPDEVVVDKVILDFDPETKEPLIEIDKGLVKKLKPHQANGIKFMWDACFESVKRIKKDNGSGCILAHCMGLGKTLQVVALTHTLLTHSELTRVERVLVVCPLSTVLNWVNEFRMWLKYSETDYEVDIYELSRYKQNSERAFQLSQWYTHGGVCVLGYEMFRNLSADNPKKFKKKMLKTFQESLVDPGPHMVVCDEGHLLKNEKTSLSQSMNRVRSLRRIVLTGTPLQNNLKEYYCMVQFVKPNLLGKYNEYLNRFVNPITNGQYTDSTEHDIRIMKRRSHVLHKMLDGAVQRRDYGVLAPFLPPKHEYVLFITLSEVQIKLYQHYLDNYSRRPLPGKSSGFLFPDFQSLQRIWTHPLVLKYNSERYEIMQQKKRDKEEEEDSEGSLVDFIDDDSTPDDSSTEESSDDLSDVSDDSRKKKKKKSAKKSKNKVSTRRGTRANPGNLDSEEPQDNDILEVKNENPTEWWIPMVTDDEIEDIHNSHKLVLLFEILRQCEAIGDKLLVFSQSLYSLDLIEHFLGKVDEATQEGRIDEKLAGHVGSWSPGVDYFRLDGSTSCENRSIWCKNFNREDNPRARLFLISTRAGGLGINLVAANRVIIFDVSWNPSHDVQSIFRVYRFGQKKPCYVYRFMAMGTMEEKIYERQVTKQAISKRVIDEQQIDRHYAENDLAELYNFEPRPPAPRPVPLVPKDRLFAEMLKDHDALIYKFHEHDSLLENKEEETLTEEERKAAWEDFENEKNRPPPSPFPQGWPMHNGMTSNMLAQQQQQQLAYAALATLLRKDMPNMTDEHVRSMLPLIYGANPGLIQKLNDIYKYPQANPGMMNPQMMNSVMNPGAGGGMGSGGSSGLQYEPPWARDQQMRMLMQQNPMGAKYYAGGLGSRDPVAMALQQQRAREMLLGDRGASAALAAAARPRGRPPLQRPGPPRPPTTAGDVVNLADSD